MNYVEPIRDPQKVKAICEYLKKTNERNYIMFRIGIYSGLRISDILRLKVRDVKNKDHIYIKEKKTKKAKRFLVNQLLRKDLKLYCQNKDMDEYLIKSREGTNKPITREMAYKILRDIGDYFNIPNLGTHTMRKTFGYHHYLQYKDVVTLQKIFNHSDPSITLRYIGLEQEYLDKSIDGFKIY